MNRRLAFLVMLVGIVMPLLVFGIWRPGDAGIRPPPLLATPQLVNRPAVHLDDTMAKDLADVIRNLRPGKVVEVQRIHAIVHALRLFGADAEFGSDQFHNSSRMLRILLSTPEFHRFSPASNDLLFLTRFGVAERVGDRFDAFPHTEKLLSVLAELAVPDSAVVEVGGVQTEVKAIVDEATARFEIRQSELAWTAIAFAAYLPPKTAWVNRFGKQTTFDDLAHALLARPWGGGACYGTHTLYSLAYLLRTHDARFPILSDLVRANVRARLKEVSAHLVAAQFKNGLWAPFWENIPTSNQGDGYPMAFAPKNVIRASGHHLEWMALAPDDCRPPTATITLAARGCLLWLADRSRTEAIPEYGPMTHAARALCLLGGLDAAALGTAKR